MFTSRVFSLTFLPAILFTFCNSIVIVSCSEYHSHVALPSAKSSENQYYLQFLNKTQWDTVILKCCPDHKILNDNGSCVDIERSGLNSTGFKNTNLRKWIQSIMNEDSQRDFRLIYRRSYCPYALQQLTFDIETAPDLSIISDLQLALRPPRANITQLRVGTQYVLVNPEDFCIDQVSETNIGLQLCISESCRSVVTSIPSAKQLNFHEGKFKWEAAESASQTKSSSFPPGKVSRPLCLLKCCPPSQVINMTSFTCVSHSIPWQLYPISTTSNPLSTKMMKYKYSDHSSNSSFQTDDDDDDNYNINGESEIQHASPLPVTWLTGIPGCTQTYDVYTDSNTYDSYYINADGLLITEERETLSETPPGDYCFDGVVLEGESPGESGKDRTKSRQMAMVCFEEKSDSREEKQAGHFEDAEAFNWRILYTVLTGISCIFLFITCSVYGILRKDLNLPGWLQFSYALSLLLTFTLLAVAQLWTQQIHDISKSLCKALGYGLHFFFLSCFFWLTSMNLDLWLSFRNTVLVRGFGKYRGKRRFLEFAAFSLGFPAAITLVLLAADNCNADGVNPFGSICVLPSSGIGEASCVFDTRHKTAQLHYFYGFVGILLLINLVIFVCTLISLRNRERETRIAKRQSTSNCDYDRLQLFTRLFLIMGVLWIFEVICWIFEYFYGTFYKVFIFTDCLNASQGVAVFFMFVWKRQTWKQLKKKLKSGGGYQGRRGPLSRHMHNCAENHGQQTNETSTKSSHLSSTKSTDSSQQPSNSTTISQFELDR